MSAAAPVEYSIRRLFGQIEVCVFHPDSKICEAIGLQLRIEGFRVSASVRKEDFLASLAEQSPQIVIVPVEHEGTSGPDLAFSRTKRGKAVRVLAMAEPAQMAEAVAAMRNHTFDIISLPLNGERLYQQVRAAVEDLTEFTSPVTHRMRLRKPLTEREQQVLDLVVEGKSNKDAARELKISPRTVEVHRARVMEKVGATNTATLVRMILQHRA
jgi:FixJ family two-component response regulator